MDALLTAGIKQAVVGEQATTRGSGFKPPILRGSDGLYFKKAEEFLKVGNDENTTIVPSENFK